MSHYNISGTSQEEGLLTSGSNISYWIDTVESLIFTPLDKDLETETVIVGGGISGLSVAYRLTKAGRKVILIDDGYIGSGETGRTTAHLVNALDDRFTEIEKMHGADNSRLTGESHTSAIDFIESVIKSENLECEFKRTEGYLFLHPSDEAKSLEEELEATHRAGIMTELLDYVPGISNENGPCLRFPNQAQFHPMKYLKGLTACIVKNGGQIFTETHATEFEKEGVKANGHYIKATHIVIATNSPVNDLVTMHTKQFPYRTYVIGGLIPKGSLIRALWWDTGNTKSKLIVDPYHYIRTQPFSDLYDLLFAGGEDHKTGQADTENIPEESRFQKLEDWTRKRFPMMEEIIYNWSGQVLEPLDSLAFIGRNPGNKNTYIATGDSGNGMTHGTIAGMLIGDLIQGIENPWEKLYDPARITLKVTGDFLKEVGNMAAQYVDYFKPDELKSVQELQANQGAIITMGAKKIAVYKDEKKVLHAYSAVCPHLGCVVQWNSSESSFDCPCHGSRFTHEGKVINGPASSDLKTVKLE